MNFESRSFNFRPGEPPVVIAEAGVNHNGDPALALELVRIACAAGAHVVKFQAFKTENEISRFAPLAPYQQETAPDAQTQFDLCKALELPAPALAGLQRACADAGIGFLCSVFDFESLDFLATHLRVKAVKIGSGEITNLPLLQRIGELRLGAILSTGASTLDEVARAVDALHGSGSPEIVLLHCVSSYPAPVAQLNLRAMETLRRRFGLPVGFSDHSIGNEAAVAATALGACAIEKHFTISKSMQGPDHRASAEPEELRVLVAAVESASSALGDGLKRPAACELPNLALIRRSLVARGDLPQGALLTRQMIEIKRPAGGIDPGDLDKVIGRKLARALKDDQPIEWSSLV